MSLSVSSVRPSSSTSPAGTSPANSCGLLEAGSVCPVCGSADLYYEAGGYTGKIYHCKNCDYMGALIVEADEEMAGAIKDDYEHKKHTA